jgi:hypothetical protein
MADGTQKPIELVEIGERVVGLGGINTVIGLARPKLRERGLYGFKDTGAFFSSEHCFWIETPEGEEYWGTHDFNAYIKEKRYFQYRLNGNIMRYGYYKKDPYVITEAIKYATIEGWKKNKVVNFRKEHDPNTQLYQLLTDGSHSIVVNGYFVAGEANDDDFDYNKKYMGGFN